MRAQVLLTIVEAHEAGFARDGRLERLRGAKRLLDHYLGPLDLLDEQGRAAAEERRVRLIDVIAAIEERQRTEAELLRKARDLTPAAVSRRCGAEGVTPRAATAAPRTRPPGVTRGNSS